MTKLPLTLLLFFCALGLFSQNRPIMNHDAYLNDWKKVTEFEQKSLPRSAAGIVDQILHRAIQEKNGPQVIKALIHQGKYDLALDMQNDTLIFRNLDEMARRAPMWWSSRYSIPCWVNCICNTTAETGGPLIDVRNWVILYRPT